MLTQFLESTVPGHRSKWLTPGQRRIIKWAGLAAGLAMFLYVVVYIVPVYAPRGRINEAEDITRKTFKEKLGKEPDKLTFGAADRRQFQRRDHWEELWALEGIAQLGEEMYDVRVTSLKNTFTNSILLQCDVAPRK